MRVILLAIGTLLLWGMLGALSATISISEGKAQTVYDLSAGFTIQLKPDNQPPAATLLLASTQTKLACTPTTTGQQVKGPFDCQSDGHAVLTLEVTHRDPSGSKSIVKFTTHLDQVALLAQEHGLANPLTLKEGKPTLIQDMTYAFFQSGSTFVVKAVQPASADVIYRDERIRLDMDRGKVISQEAKCIRLLNTNPARKQIYLEILAADQCPENVVAGPIRPPQSPFADGKLYLGIFAYPQSDQLSGYENAYQAFEKSTDVKQNIYLNYINYGNPFKTDWAKLVVEHAKKQKKTPILQIGFEPVKSWDQGCDELDTDGYLRKFLQDADSIGVPILLRFASEMNAYWQPYYTKPETYISCFNKVGLAVHRWTKNVYMIWSPFPKIGTKAKYENYWPGYRFVDAIGISLYVTPIMPCSAVGPKCPEKDISFAFANTLDPIYEFANKKQKDLMVSEYGIAAYYQDSKKKPATYKDWTAYAANGIAKLYAYPASHPRLKAIVGFEADLPKFRDDKTKSWSVLLDCDRMKSQSNCRLVDQYRKAVSPYLAATNAIQIAG